jgi:arginine repressor
MKENVVRQELTRMGCECFPPLSASEIDGAIEQSKHNRKQIRDSTIADYLKVTPDEAQHVPRWADRHALPEITCSDMNLKHLKRADNRRQAEREIVDAMGRVPSCREMAELLRQRGIQISHVQVSRDYLDQHMTQRSPLALLPFSAVSDVTLVEMK